MWIPPIVFLSYIFSLIILLITRRVFWSFVSIGFFFTAGRFLTTWFFDNPSLFHCAGFFFPTEFFRTAGFFLIPRTVPTFHSLKIYISVLIDFRSSYLQILIFLCYLKRCCSFICPFRLLTDYGLISTCSIPQRCRPLELFCLPSHFKFWIRDLIGQFCIWYAGFVFHFEFLILPLTLELKNVFFWNLFWKAM